MKNFSFGGLGLVGFFLLFFSRFDRLIEKELTRVNSNLFNRLRLNESTYFRGVMPKEKTK